MPALAEIHLGADAGRAQGLRHFLVVGDAGLVHDEHDDRAVARRCVRLAERSSAACSRETPMEKPVAGTFSPGKRSTSPS